MGERSQAGSHAESEPTPGQSQSRQGQQTPQSSQGQRSGSSTGGEHGAPQQQQQSQQSIADLQGAARVLEEELERQDRLARASQTLKAALGPGIHQTLAELAKLDERRQSLAQEIGQHEARLVELRAEVGQEENMERRRQSLAQEIGSLEARKAQLEHDVQPAEVARAS